MFKKTTFFVKNVDFILESILINYSSGIEVKALNLNASM